MIRAMPERKRFFSIEAFPYVITIFAAFWLKFDVQIIQSLFRQARLTLIVRYNHIARPG